MHFLLLKNLYLHVKLPQSKISVVWSNLSILLVPSSGKMLNCRIVTASKFTTWYLLNSSSEENNPCQASSKITSLSIYTHTTKMVWNAHGVVVTSVASVWSGFYLVDRLIFLSISLLISMDNLQSKLRDPCRRDPKLEGHNAVLWISFPTVFALLCY